MNPLPKDNGICLSRGGHDMFREQSPALRADISLILQSINDRRLNLMPMNPLLPVGTSLLSPVLATMPSHPSVHHDDENIIRLCSVSARR